ncbi:sugar-binding domain-containing protein [Sphingobacterium sp. E70]|uniref:sugar-binding domain-containing protein n=1 Tax=Sphingobacterium sp. E70 TaxID=2853439 RepID=UPI00359C5044
MLARKCSVANGKISTDDGITWAAVRCRIRVKLALHRHFRKSRIHPRAFCARVGTLRNCPEREKFLWYRRALTIPSAWKGKRILLHFGAVDQYAVIFVNGKR